MLFFTGTSECGQTIICITCANFLVISEQRLKDLPENMMRETESAPPTILFWLTKYLASMGVYSWWWCIIQRIIFCVDIAKPVISNYSYKWNQCNICWGKVRERETTWQVTVAIFNNRAVNFSEVDNVTSMEESSISVVEEDTSISFNNHGKRNKLLGIHIPRKTLSPTRTYSYVNVN